RRTARRRGVRNGPSFVYIEEEDEPFLARLCADDERLGRFWRLAEGMPDDRFFNLIEGILTAAGLPGTLIDGRKEHRENLFLCDAALQRIYEACEILNYLPSNVTEQRHGTGDRLVDYMVIVAHGFEEAHKLMLRQATESEQSNKLKNSPQQVFMAHMAETEDLPHETIGELAEVLFDLASQPTGEAVRKARDRQRERDADID